MPEQFPKKIKGTTEISLAVDQSALYGVTITARCQGKHDLRVEIDALKLREIPTKDKPQYNNIPPSWNGSKLKGLAKTIIFILRLNKGKHKLTFISNEEAIVDEYKIAPVSNPQNILFNLEIQAEDGDRRPWYTFVLVDLSLKSITADISTKWHFLDGDDVKLIIDQQIKKNLFSILHRNWIWAAGILRKLFGKEREEKTFTEDLNLGVHYIEFWADRTPTLHSVRFDLGKITQKRIPTMDDPAWTGDFNDDTEQMILARAIYGEAGGESIEAKIGVGWAIRNRVNDNQNRWGKTYHEVILEPYQFEPFNDSSSDIFKKITNPPIDNPGEEEVWENSFKSAVQVIQGDISDPTKDSNHFYVPLANQPKPSWADDEKFTVQIGATRFYNL